MKNEVIKQVGDYIDAIASKLGVAAEHVYGILIKQQIVDGAIGVTVGLVLGLTTYFLLKQAIKDGTEDYTKTERGTIINKGMRNEGRCIGLTITGSLIGLIALLFFFFNLGQLINPEYYAIKDIMSMVTGND